MKKIKVLLNCDPNLKIDLAKTEYNFFVGIDAGCRFFYQQKKKFDLAIGDFDHFENKKIKKLAKKNIILAAKKDVLDLEYCLNYLQNNFVIESIDLFIPHLRIDFDFYLLKMFNQYSHLYVYNSQFLIFKLKANNYFSYLKFQKYHYFSIICLQQGIVEIKNFKYSGLFKMNYLETKFFSNEMIENRNGVIKINNGTALIVCSKK